LSEGAWVGVENGAGSGGGKGWAVRCFVEMLPSFVGSMPRRTADADADVFHQLSSKKGKNVWCASGAKRKNIAECLP